MKRFAITTGDQDGIGPEVTVKALRELGPQKGASFVVFRGPESESLFAGAKLPFRRIVCSTLDDALTVPASPRTLVEVAGGEPVSWVEDAAKACLRKDLQGLITGPLSKSLIRKTGRKDLGHTEILLRLSKAKAIYQGYLGEHFQVVLATAHLPLKEVSRKLTPAVLAGALSAARELAAALPKGRGRKPLALLGMNPHAGEDGLIGREELMFRQVLRTKKGRGAVGPLVPDAAFSPKNWKNYSVFIASYHDQGLIPFKMIHGQSGGAQISLGLPFVRTSVDHGTAKEIAGRNLADPGSMRDAIRWCLQLTKGI